uniref:6,7-dimethyl-8-ribityllumazine synthase n=1 Tax=Priestia megaterium TaxID=1404 RepID=UPI0021C144E4
MGMVVGGFNELIRGGLVSGGEDGLKGEGVGDEDVDVGWVGGGYEIGLMGKKLGECKKYDGVIRVGRVIGGGT